MAFLFPAIISGPIVHGVYEVGNGTRELVPKYWKNRSQKPGVRSLKSEV